MLLKIIAALVGILVLLIGGGWVGLQAASPSFPMLKLVSKDLGTMPIPASLPAPVQRYARTLFGEQVPVVESAIMTGRAKVRFNGLTMQARFKFTYEVARGHYHHIQATWFGVPLFTVNERFLDGQAILDIPGQHVENDPHTNHAASQGFWAEAFMSMPSVFITDPRLRWEAIDDTSARLIVPGTDAEEAFIVGFDPETGLVATLTTQRYQDAQGPRHSWNNRIVKWGKVNGILTPIQAETQWDNDPPWAIWQVEQIVYNVPVAKRMNQFGGEVEG
ncbi:MAG TPA: DUF6544 family protein [Phototrophicaceae bacterium]|nr:DUF6544 family protein [Phototrophicaceae bacterium]